MDRIDRLLLKVKPKMTTIDRLSENNPYMEQSFEELIEYMDGNNYRAPEMGTWEWDQYMLAVMNAYSDGRRNGMEVVE